MTPIMMLQADNDFDLSSNYARLDYSSNTRVFIHLAGIHGHYFDNIATWQVCMTQQTAHVSPVSESSQSPTPEALRDRQQRQNKSR